MRFDDKLVAITQSQSAFFTTRHHIVIRSKLLGFDAYACHFRSCHPSPTIIAERLARKTVEKQTHLRVGDFTGP